MHEEGDRIGHRLEQLEQARKEFGGSLQAAASESDIRDLKINVRNNYGIDLSTAYEFLLVQTNGFVENGVYLYGTKTNPVEGSPDIIIDGVIEATETWCADMDIADHLFYGDSDMYLFAQSLQTGRFSVHDRSNFDDIVYETSSDIDFFGKIIMTALGEDPF